MGCALLCGYDLQVNRILVVGGNGFIGKRLVRKFEDSHTDYLVLDLSGGPSEKFIKAGIASDDLNAIFQGYSPTAVVHLAAQIDVRESFVNPIHDLEVNILGTVRLLEAANKAQCRNFVYIASGGAIYDSDGILPHKESARELPVSPYGVSKGAAEEYVRVLSAKYGSHWSSLALSNCYGPVREHGRGVIYQFWRAITQNESAKIYGSEVTRDFVHVDDAIEAICLAIKNPTNCRVNVSSNTEISLFDLYSKVAQELGSKLKAEIHEAIVGEVLRSKLDNSLAFELLGWAPRIDLDEGIKTSLSGIKSQQ
jgi:UDP-glucose 4-epimerase